MAVEVTEANPILCELGTRDILVVYVDKMKSLRLLFTPNLHIQAWFWKSVDMSLHSTSAFLLNCDFPFQP